MPESSIQPLAKSEPNLNSPNNSSAYNQPNQSPELLMLENARSTVATPIVVEKQQQHQQHSSQQIGTAQTPPIDNQHMNQNNNNQWHPLTPPQ